MSQNEGEIKKNPEKKEKTGENEKRNKQRKTNQTKIDEFHVRRHWRDEGIKGIVYWRLSTSRRVSLLCQQKLWDSVLSRAQNDTDVKEQSSTRELWRNECRRLDRKTDVRRAAFDFGVGAIMHSCRNRAPKFHCVSRLILSALGNGNIGRRAKCP